MRNHSGALELSGLGRSSTLPSSLSSRLSNPGLSVYSFTCRRFINQSINKSPWVSHMGLEASAWSVCNFSPPSTSMVQ
ncbi:unnamed protein product [Ixodes persulcatus]